MKRRKFDPIILPKEKYVETIERELQNGRELNALFLAHGYIEAYLLHWILVSGKVKKLEFSRAIIDGIKRISFNNLLHVNLMLGNLSNELYAKVREFNQKRNDFAHFLIAFDITDGKTKEKIKRIAINGIELLKEISQLYTKTLDEKQETFK